MQTHSNKPSLTGQPAAPAHHRLIIDKHSHTTTEMTILSRNAILKLIREGRLKITPFNEDQVGPGSIDLTLGNEFRVFQTKGEVIHAAHNIPVDSFTQRVTVKDGDHLLLKPGELVHGISREQIELPDNIAGWLEGRSSYARIGLMIHMSAGLVQPGTRNKQVLEIGNMSPLPIALHPGTRICQLVLETVKGKARYSGRFKNQDAP